MNQTAPVFQVSALSKAFRGRRALDVPVLSVGAGEKVALIGAPGSGMSTLLRHMAGLMLGDAGEVQVHDRVVQSRGRLSRGGCGPGWAWCSSSSTWSAACRC